MSARQVARLFADEAGIPLQPALDFVRSLDLTMQVARRLYSDAANLARETDAPGDVCFFTLLAQHMFRHLDGTLEDALKLASEDAVRELVHVLYVAMEHEAERHREERLAAGISDVPVGDA